jgi:hypothetical protein
MSRTFQGVIVTITVATVLIGSGFGQVKTNEPIKTVRISGRIVDSDGSPVGQLFFELVATHQRRCGFCSANDGYGRAYVSFSVTTDRNGRFSATVPADTYDLVGYGFGYYIGPYIKSVKRIDVEPAGQLELEDVVNPGFLPMPHYLPLLSAPSNDPIKEPLASILRQR